MKKIRPLFILGGGSLKGKRGEKTKKIAKKSVKKAVSVVCEKCGEPRVGTTHGCDEKNARSKNKINFCKKQEKFSSYACI